MRLEGEERLDAARRPRSRRRARRPGMRGGLCAHARGVAGGGRGQQGQGERPTHCRGTACRPLAAVVAGRAAAQQQQNHLHSLLDLTRESSLVRTSPRAVAPRRRLALLVATEGRQHVVDVEHEPRAARPLLLPPALEERRRSLRRREVGPCRPPLRASREGRGGRREHVFARDRSMQSCGRRRRRVADDSGCRRDQLASALVSNAVLSDELGRLDRDQHRATALADKLRPVAGGSR